jgi:hypothetical protein
MQHFTFPFQAPSRDSALQALHFGGPVATRIVPRTRNHLYHYGMSRLLKSMMMMMRLLLQKQNGPVWQPDPSTSSCAGLSFSQQDFQA